MNDKTNSHPLNGWLFLVEHVKAVEYRLKTKKHTTLFVMCPVLRFDCIFRLVDGLFRDFAEAIRTGVVASEQGGNQALLDVESFVGVFLQILFIQQVIVPFLVFIEHFIGGFCIIADEHEIDPAHEMQSQIVA